MHAFLQAGLDRCNRPRRVEWWWSRRRAAPVGGAVAGSRVARGGAHDQVRPTYPGPSHRGPTCLHLQPSYPRPRVDLPCTTSPPTEPGDCCSGFAGAGACPVADPAHWQPLLAGWRGLTSRPNRFCQLDTKTTHTDLPPTSLKEKSSKTPPTQDQHRPTLHPRPSYPRPSVDLPRTKWHIHCTSHPATLYSDLPYTTSSPATLYRVEPTLHPSGGGRWQRIDPEPDHRSPL